MTSGQRALKSMFPVDPRRTKMVQKKGTLLSSILSKKYGCTEGSQLRWQDQNPTLDSRNAVCYKFYWRW